VSYCYNNLPELFVHCWPNNVRIIQASYYNNMTLYYLQQGMVNKEAVKHYQTHGLNTDTSIFVNISTIFQRSNMRSIGNSLRNCQFFTLIGL